MTPAAWSLRQRHAAKPLKAGTAPPRPAHLDAAAIPPARRADGSARLCTTDDAPLDDVRAIVSINAALDDAGAIGADADVELGGRRSCGEPGPKGHEGGKTSRFQSVTHVLSRLHSKSCPADNVRPPGVFRRGALRRWRWRMI
jgi:hypothetical protein